MYVSTNFDSVSISLHKHKLNYRPSLLKEEFMDAKELVVTKFRIIYVAIILLFSTLNARITCRHNEACTRLVTSRDSCI